MNESINQITSRILTLPRRSRALLADLLLDSLDYGPTITNEDAWLELAKKRDKEISDGKISYKTHEGILTSAREAIRCSKEVKLNGDG